MTRTTCQICGRAIKANTGIIAAHGYKRPGYGWQTASCYGARHQPYEVSCSAIEPAIAHGTRVREHTAITHLGMFYDPPAEFDVTRKDAWGKRGPTRIAARPAVFDPQRPGIDINNPGTYAYAWQNRERDLRSTLRDVREYLTFLQTRLTNWRPQ
jgi:hypothetical protein